MRVEMKIEWLIAAAAMSALAATGCSSSEPVAGGERGNAGASELTYYKDVKPILDAKCSGCHTAGGIAPFELKTLDDAMTYKAEIASAVSSRAMPPWPPDDSCASYVGDRSLTDEEIHTVVQWADGASAAGEPSQYAARETPRDGLSRVDVTLGAPAAYTPTTRPDEYRCFLVDWPASTTRYITGFGVKPGDAAIVHHVLLYQIPADRVAEYQAYDDADPGAGYPCFGGPRGNADKDAPGSREFPPLVAGWVPGSPGYDFPAGIGMKVDPGAKMVIQIHYNTLYSPPAADATRVELKVDDHADKQAFVVPWTNPKWTELHQMSIPAGAPDTMYSFAYDPFYYASVFTKNAITQDAPITIFSAGMHMHLHGTRGELSIQRSGGQDECLLAIKKWNFHWQGSYTFTQARQVMPGDKLKIECHWDNSARNQPEVDGEIRPPADLNWGEGTTDEMCVSFLYLTQ